MRYTGMPAQDAGDWEWLLFRQDGVVSSRQARRRFTHPMAARKVSTGRWQHPHRGVYVTHSGPLTPPQRLWIAHLAVGGPLAGVAALTVLGLERFTTNWIDVLLPAARRSYDPPAGVRVHRTTNLPAPDVRLNAEPPCTTAARSLVDAAAWATSDDQARTLIAMCLPPAGER